MEVLWNKPFTYLLTYLLSYYVRGHPTTVFSQMLLNAVLGLSGVLLKLCRLILGCVNKNSISAVILEELEYSNDLLCLFCPFPENPRSYRLSEK